MSNVLICCLGNRVYLKLKYTICVTGLLIMIVMALPVVCVGLVLLMHGLMALSLVPRPRRRGKVAWYPPFVHV